MIEMYHPNAELPVLVHPSQKDRMILNGWAEKPIEAQPQPETDEVNEDGQP